MSRGVAFLQMPRALSRRRTVVAPKPAHFSQIPRFELCSERSFHLDEHPGRASWPRTEPLSILAACRTAEHPGCARSHFPAHRLAVRFQGPPPPNRNSVPSVTAWDRPPPHWWPDASPHGAPGFSTSVLPLLQMIGSGKNFFE